MIDEVITGALKEIVRDVLNSDAENVVVQTDQLDKLANIFRLLNIPFGLYERFYYDEDNSSLRMKGIPISDYKPTKEDFVKEISIGQKVEEQDANEFNTNQEI